MTGRRPSLDASYFESIYRGDPDPWRFRTSAYEAGKYAATLASLGRPRYARCLEVGCSIGVLTRMLAARCDQVLAIDVSERALAVARRDLSDLPRVEFRRAGVPAAFPDGRFDLIVLSEVLYYLGVDDLEQVARQVMAAVEPDGEVVLCHWTGMTDYPLSGDDAAALFAEATATRLRVRHAERHAEYRLERLSTIEPEHRSAADPEAGARPA